MEMIAAGVFRAYASWVSDHTQGEGASMEDKKKDRATREFVSERLLDKSVSNLHVGVILRHM